jgi:hypothetical protein
VVPGSDVVIVGTTFRSKFGDYYNGKANLQNAIATKAATLATWAGTTGTGKPSDNATVGAVAGTNLKDSYGNVLADGAVKNNQSAFSPKYVWEFRNTLDGWSTAGASATPGADAVTLTSTTVDPNFLSPSVSVAGGLYTKVRARVRRTAGAGWDGILFYTNSAHGYSSSFCRAIPDTTSGAFTVLEWDMENLPAGGTDWTAGTTTLIRIDLGTSAADVFEIDWIAVGKVGPVTIGDLGYSGALNATANVMTSGAVAPAAPNNGDVWIDTNAPTTIRTRVAGAWVAGGNIPTSLSHVSTTEAGKLGGIAAGATVGAPSGTNVGSTAATTVESNAAAGASANSQISGINSAIADKLSKTSPSSLAATVTMANGGSFLSGTTANGVYMAPTGLFGVQGGVAKFSVPISGDPTFAGQLTAAYGTFGAVMLPTGGYVASGAFTSYAWPAGTGTGFYLGPEGLLIGNPSGPGFFQYEITTGKLLTNNFTIINGVATFSGKISGATYDPYSVPAITAINSGGANGSRNVNTNPAAPTGGVAPYTYLWTVSGDPGLNYKINGGSTSTFVSVYASGTNYAGSVYCNVTVTDANGRTAQGSTSLNITFGVPP